MNGTRLYYEVAGSGPAIVLVHGFALDRRMWDEQVAAFADRYTVVRYDLRGFGLSAMPGEEPYSHYQDLRALLSLLGIARFHVLGLSLGGAICVDFALAFPDAVMSLIVADVSALGGYPWPNEFGPWFDNMRSAARSGDLTLARQHWLATDWFSAAHKNPAVLARLEQMAADYSCWHFLHDNPSRSLTPLANERLGEIAVPTLVVVGERDIPFYNLAIADRLESGIVTASKVVLPDAGHMSNMEAPERFNAVVSSFLEQSKL